MMKIVLLLLCMRNVFGAVIWLLLQLLVKSNGQHKGEQWVMGAQHAPLMVAFGVALTTNIKIACQAF